MTSPAGTPYLDDPRHLRDLRERDHIRYLSCLTAKREDRALYTAFALLHAELYAAADPKRDPVARHMRLEWWRAALHEAFDGVPRNHDLLQTFAALKKHYTHRLHTSSLNDIIDSAARFRDTHMPATYDAWRLFCAQTSGAWAQHVAAAIYPDMPHIRDYVDAAAAVRGAVSCVFAVTGTHPNRRVMLPQEGLNAYDLTETRIIERMRPKETMALLEDIYSHIQCYANTQRQAFNRLSRSERRRLYPMRVLAYTAEQDIARARKKCFPPGAGASRSVALSIAGLIARDALRR